MSYTINNKFNISKITYYIELIKPKIIIGNIISLLGGFFIASQEKIFLSLLFETIIGTSLIIAANCVLNNIIDQKIDVLMKRTQHRVLVIKLIKSEYAFIYAILLFLLGFYILFYTTNLQVIYLITISSIIYIGIYSLLMKKKSIYSTLIGSISGSTPPAIGYCTVTNNFDTGALILMILLFLWQIPHSYSIAIFRFTDYKNASIPTFPLKKGIMITKQHMIYSIILFMIDLVILTFKNNINYLILILIETLSGIWLYVACMNIKINKDDNNHHTNITQWSKKMFIISIIIIISLNIAISIDSLYHLKINNL